MKQKRILGVLSMCLILILSLTACQSNKSYSFQIDNGEKIKITLDTSDGHNLLQKDGVFTIQKDDEDILKGYFLTADGYKEKAALVSTSNDVEMITATPEDSPTFYCYQFKGAAGIETDFLFKIEGAETGAIIGSLESREEAEVAFNLLEFEKLK